jgi:hypothetical protein
VGRVAGWAHLSHRGVVRTRMAAVAAWPAVAVAVVAVVVLTLVLAMVALTWE